MYLPGLKLYSIILILIYNITENVFSSISQFLAALKVSYLAGYKPILNF